VQDDIFCVKYDEICSGTSSDSICFKGELKGGCYDISLEISGFTIIEVKDSIKKIEKAIRQIDKTLERSSEITIFGKKVDKVSRKYIFLDLDDLLSEEVMNVLPTIYSTALSVNRIGLFTAKDLNAINPTKDIFKKLRLSQKLK
jgi:archaellum component FlaC